MYLVNLFIGEMDTLVLRAYFDIKNTHSFVFSKLKYLFENEIAQCYSEVMRSISSYMINSK